MTHDDIIKALRREGARLQFGKMDDDKVVDLVDQLLNRGVYFDEFLGVLDHSSFRPDFVKHVTATFAKLGIDLPKTRDEAVWALLRLHIPAMADPKNDPMWVLSTLISDTYRDYDFGQSIKKYVGDAHGIEDLIGLDWGYDDLCERHFPHAPPTSETEEIAESVREAAVVWLNRFRIQN